MKIRIKKYKNLYIPQVKKSFIWLDIYDKRHKTFITFNSEDTALEFIAKYSSFIEDKILINIDSKTIKSKLPQYFI